MHHNCSPPRRTLLHLSWIGHFESPIPHPDRGPFDGRMRRTPAVPWHEAESGEPPRGPICDLESTNELSGKHRGPHSADIDIHPGTMNPARAVNWPFSRHCACNRTPCDQRPTRTAATATSPSLINQHLSPSKPICRVARFSCLPVARTHEIVLLGEFRANQERAMALSRPGCHCARRRAGDLMAELRRRRPHNEERIVALVREHPGMLSVDTAALRLVQ